jgi:uncharacterized oligopeptide transporter (OPT) family protein
MSLNLISIIIITIIIVVPLHIFHLKQKTSLYKTCFTSISFGIIAVVVAGYCANLMQSMIFLISGMIMTILPLAVLLFHNLQKERLQKMVKDEIANELNQMKAKDL